MEHRVLLLAVRGRDAQIIADLLERQGNESHSCNSPDELAAELGKGAACALITEESLTSADLVLLKAWLSKQEPWSDFPFILLATKRAGRRPQEAARTLQALGNVVVLERPIHVETLASAVSSAQRVRRRQYEARERLIALEKAESRLTHLNSSLETRITERTAELSRANNRLMEEIAERERAQAALAQSQKLEAIGQLTGGIAHDFNNLLTVIIGNLDLIGRRTHEKSILGYASNAVQAAERAAKLTQQLLAFSRTQQLSLEPVSVNSVVLGMKDMLERTIGQQVQKKLLLSEPAPWVMADSNQLELAILNLAINARDAMPDGGLLTIATCISEDPPGELPPSRYGIVTVADTGMGIAPKLMSRVFDPFFTTKPVGKGTGLGLSQVIGIAKQSGGTASVVSTEGAGTSVSIWLPTVVPPPPAADVEANFAVPKAKGHVLVIDDDDGVRGYIAEGLETLGYTVTAAASGEEGLACLKKDPPDLLIVDFAMNGMDGGEVSSRAVGLIPELPVILATGYAEIADASSLTSIRSVLRKPFKIAELADCVRDALKCPEEAQ